MIQKIPINILLRSGVFLTSFAIVFHFYFFEEMDSKGAVTDFIAIIELNGEYPEKIKNEDQKVKQNREGDLLFVGLINAIRDEINSSKVYSGKSIILGVNAKKGYIYSHRIDGGSYIEVNVNRAEVKSFQDYLKKTSSAISKDNNQRDTSRILVEFKNKIIIKSNAKNKNQAKLYETVNKKNSINDYIVIFHRPLTRDAYETLETCCAALIKKYDEQLFKRFKGSLSDFLHNENESTAIWDRTYSVNESPERFQLGNQSYQISPIGAIADYLEKHVSIKQTHFYLASNFLGEEPAKEVADKFVRVISKNPSNYFHFVLLPTSKGSTQQSNFASLYNRISRDAREQSKKPGKPPIKLRKAQVNRNFFYKKAINSILVDVEENRELAEKIGTDLEEKYGGKAIFETHFKERNGIFLPDNLRAKYLASLLNENYLKVLLFNGDNKYSQGLIIKNLLLDSNFSEEKHELITQIKQKARPGNTRIGWNVIKLLMLMDLDDYNLFSKIFYKQKEIRKYRNAIESFRRAPMSSFKTLYKTFGQDILTLDAQAKDALDEFTQKLGFVPNFSNDEASVFLFACSELDSGSNEHKSLLATIVLSSLNENEFFELLRRLKVVHQKTVTKVEKIKKRKFLDIVLDVSSVTQPNSEIRFKAIPLEQNKRFYTILASESFDKARARADIPDDFIAKRQSDHIRDLDTFLLDIVSYYIDYERNYGASRNIIVSPKDRPSLINHIVSQIFHKDFRYTPSIIMASLCLVMSIFSIFYLRVSSNLITGYGKEAKYIFRFELSIALVVIFSFSYFFYKGQYLISPELAVNDPLFNKLKYIFYFLTLVVLFLLFFPFITNHTNLGHLWYFTKLKADSFRKSTSLLLPYLIAILVVMIPSTQHGLTFANLPKSYAYFVLGGLFIFYVLLFFLHIFYEQDNSIYKTGLSSLDNKVKEFVDQTVEYRKDDPDDLTKMLIRAKGFDFKEFIPVDINQGLKDLSLSASLKHGAFMYPLGYSALQGKLVKKDFDLEQMGDLMFISFISDDLINTRLACIPRAELRQKTGAYMAKAWLELVKSVYSKWTFSAYFPRSNNLHDYYQKGDIDDFQEYFNDEIMLAIKGKKKLTDLRKQVQRVLTTIPLDMDIVMLTDTYYANDCRALMIKFIQGTRRMGIVINIEDQYKTVKRFLFDYYGAYPEIWPKGWRIRIYKKSLSNLLEVTTNLPTSLNASFRTPLKNALGQLIKKNESQI